MVKKERLWFYGSTFSRRVFRRQIIAIATRPIAATTSANSSLKDVGEGEMIITSSRSSSNAETRHVAPPALRRVVRCAYLFACQ